MGQLRDSKYTIRGATPI